VIINAVSTFAGAPHPRTVGIAVLLIAQT
jgi:hypothetical protein